MKEQLYTFHIHNCYNNLSFKITRTTCNKATSKYMEAGQITVGQLKIRNLNLDFSLTPFRLAYHG